MPTLSDRLKSMGVKIGARDLPAPKPSRTYPVENVIAGRFKDIGNGLTFIIEEDYPEDYLHGQVRLRLETAPRTIAEWSGEAAITEQALESYAFLDTETSGLAGGTGTFAFLVGVGRFTPDGFHLAQFFMRDPLEEPSLLLALEEFLAPCRTIVSFNGKSFDVPLLNTRYTLQQWDSPFKGLSHIDLLHLSRRLWRDRLPSRTLANLEVQILHASRTDEEIPGWMIPQMYFDYLRDGDARPLKRVFYHNAMDVVSLAALLNHTSTLLEDNAAQQSSDPIDLAGVARLMEDLGHPEDAILLYQTCLSADLPDDVYDDTLSRLAAVFKRTNQYRSALPLWEKAAARHQVYAFEELAKYYEHHALDLQQAIRWTQKALDLINTAGERHQDSTSWKPVLEHRKDRLLRKINAQKA